MKRKYTLVRHLSQAAYVGLILWLTLGRLFANQRPAELHSICPFGGIETLPTFVASGGVNFARETGLSNFTLIVAVLLAVLVFGGAFCGWVCPVGAVSEWLFKLRKVFIKKTLIVPQKIHSILRWVRYVFLALALVMTLLTGVLWLQTIDPFINLFSFRALGVIAIIVVTMFVAGSLLVERFFCKYLCPFGAAMHPFAKLSATGIRRSPEECTGCKTCGSVCPMQIPIDAQSKIDRGSCISCMRCIEECNNKGALEFYMGW